MTTSTTTNREGLTWAEWCNAAGVSLTFGDTTEGQLAAYRAAWEAGEDPTEWRAALAVRRIRERSPKPRKAPRRARTLDRPVRHWSHG